MERKNLKLNLVKRMAMIDIEFNKTFHYVAKCDTETGEIVEIKCTGLVEDNTPTEVKDKKKSTTSRKKSSKKDESTTPQLILEENKCCLNTAAVELMGIEAGDKLDINYEKVKNGFRPVLTKKESGNKISKSFTIALRGSKNEALAEYGSVFEVIVHDSKPDSYILKGDKVIEETEEIDTSLPLDVDLPDLVDDEDAEITMLDASFFSID